MKQILYLKKNWNLVSFLFKTNIDEITDNENIMEIKSIFRSYNRKAPKNFNTLKEINLNQGYYIKCNEDTELILEGTYVKEISYNINEGWNLIGFPFDYELNVGNINSNIIEIRSKDESYKSGDLYKDFNTLKNLKQDCAYWFKSEAKFNYTIENENLEEEYDIVIVGAGPAGCMVSKILSEELDQNIRIALLEKGSYNISLDFEKKYRDLLEWSNSMSSPVNSNSFASLNEKTIWLGEGLGGGSLTFGLQYVDQKDLYSEIPEVLYYLDKVNDITKTENFDYSEENEELWNELYNKFSNDDTINFYNNKVYSNDLKNKQRYIAADLINDKVDVKTNAKVQKINFNGKEAKSVELENNKIIKGKFIILCGGAIENVNMLNNSNELFLDKLEIGDTIYDHAGVNFYYTPKNDFFEKYISLGHLQVRSKDLKWQIYLSKVPQVPFLVVTIAQAKKIDSCGYVGRDNNIVIQYFGNDDPMESLVEVYEYINPILEELGFENIETKTIDTKYISENHDSIYHYHGTCPFDRVVDKNYKVFGTNNLYIADISVLSKSVPGSTSVASMTLGYRFAKIFLNNDLVNNEKAIYDLEQENVKLKEEKKKLYTYEKLKNIWETREDMYVVIQNDGRIIGQGPLKVYNMGGFWKVGGRHRGGSLVDYLYREKFNFTNLLKRNHGSNSFWRISSGGAVEVGLFDDGSIDQKIKDNNDKINSLI